MSDDRQKRIERRAYEIWDREGRPSGLDAENWRRAEEEIAREDAEASAPEAKPAEAEAAPEPEPAATAKPEAKPQRAARAKSKPADPKAPSPAPKAASKAGETTGTAATEIEEKGTRKRKTAPKKK